MRNKIVAGNWKMHKTLTESQALITEIRGIVRDEFRANTAEVVVCPTSLVLASAVKLMEGSGIFVGSQNVHQENQGAYTGEISASMIASVGASHVIVGHSERRQYFNETNTVCSLKNKSSVAAGLTVLYCVGETLEERETEQHWAVIEKQIEEGLTGITSQEMHKIVIAYEPVWAIGTGKTASSAQAQEVHAFIRSLLNKKFGEPVAEATRILYGGSVKPDNAAELFAQPDIDGGLIGGASLKARDFFEIVKAAG
jgi:triosephosphate isomerase